MKCLAARLPVVVFVIVIALFMAACGTGASSTGGGANALSVSLSQSGTATTVNAGGSPVTLTAAVLNDTSNAGVTWSISPATGCGTLSSSGTTATFTAPPESSLNANCTATITSTSTANTAKTASMSFTIAAVAINLPAGENSTQSATAGVSSLALSASLANDASGSATLNWSISGAAGSSRPALKSAASTKLIAGVTSSCGSLSSATGTSVTYTPPVGIACTATVKVATSINPNVSRTFTINVALPIVTASVTAANKTYDRTNAATINGCTLAGVLAADIGNVSCSATGTFSNANAGTGKTVTATGITLGGTAASGYTLSSTTATTTANITPRALTVTAAAGTKSYDGTTSSAGVPTITTGSLIAGDTATWTQTYDNKNAGAAHVLTPAGTVSDGNGGANYNATFATINTGVITVRALTVTAAASTKAYDGTTSSTGAPTITTGSLAAGDTATWTQTYDNMNVGAAHVLTPAGTVSDGNSGNNYSPTFTTVNTGVITPKALTASVVASSKIYDATNAANITGCTLAGVLSADASNVNCSASAGTFSNANAGAGKTVTATGITLGGTAAGNYSLPLTTATTTGSITAKALTVTGAASTKTYDGTTSSSGTPTITSGNLVGSDSATWTQTYHNKNVGSAHVMTPVGTVSDGNGGANYSVTFATINSGVVTARAVTITAAASSKVYDGTTSSSGTPTITAGNLMGTDTATWTQSYDDKNVGAAHVLTPAGTISDGNGGNNYAATLASINTGVITAKSLTASVTAADKIYDGTNTASINSCSLTGVLPADTGISCSATGAFSNANAGAGKTVTASGFALLGPAANYTLATTTATTTASISTRTLTVKAASGSKVYDATTSSSGVPTITAGSLVGTDSATWTQAYEDKNIGAGHVLTPAGTVIDGNGGNNYSVTFTISPGTITARPLTVTASSDTKVYDGSTASTAVPTITAGSLAGGETAVWSQSFGTKNVGTGLALTPFGTVSDGNSGNNYSVNFAGANTGTITSKPLTASVTAADKVYDATNATTITGCTLAVVVSGDTGNVTCSAAAATFANANAGAGKTVTATGIALGGTASSNYSLPLTTANTTASITGKGLTVTAVANTKTYDGNTSSSGVPTITSGALMGGDSAAWTQTFDNKNVGNAHVLTPAGTVNDGNGGNNYSVNFATVNTGVITGKSLTVTGLTANNKVYDGTNAATLTGGTLVGVIVPDSVTLSGATVGNFISPNAGSNITVNAPGISITGPNAGNYTLTAPAGLTANITQKGLTVKADDKTMAPGAPVPLLTASYIGFVNGENQSVLGGSPLLSTTATSASPAGTYPITVTQGVLFSNNYSFTFVNGTLTINPAIFVVLSPSAPQNIDAGHSLPITATVTNDGSNQGVNFTLSPTSGCGTLSANTAPSGLPVTYSVPGNNNSCFATVTATSVADNSKFASVNINVNLALSLPAASPSPLASATTNQSYSQSLNAIGGTPGYSFNVNGTPVQTNGTPVALTNGLSVSNSGGNTLSINGTPTMVGSVPLSVSVTDGTGATVGPIAYSITVNGPGHQISGQVMGSNGPGGVQGVTVSINTTPVQTRTTDNNGQFAFAALPDGNYTVTPSYTVGGATSIFYPASQNVVLNGADQFVNFNVTLGYTVSGTVAYTGSKTGPIYITLQSNNSCYGSSYGTSIASTTLSSGGHFTIKGICPGTYSLSAWMDSIGLGVPNGTDAATSSSTSVTVPTGASQSLTLVDPATNPFGGVSGPKVKMLSPMSQGALLQFAPVTNSNGIEMPPQYRIQWSTDNTFATGVNSKTVSPTGGDQPYILSFRTGLLGLTDGASLWFRVRGESLDGVTTKTNWTTSQSAITIGAVTPTSPVTVHGNAIYAGAATTGPLYVGCFDQNTGNIFGQSFAGGGTFPQAYSVNVTGGTNCFMFGIIDNNNDSVIDTGDVSNTDGNNSNALVATGPGPISQDITLPSTNSVVSLTTSHSQWTNMGGTNDSYNLNFDLRRGLKLPVAVRLNSGPNVLLPTDIAPQQNNKGGRFQYWTNVGGSRPKTSPADVYGLNVTYSDGTSEIVNATVTTVLDNFAQNLAADTTTGGATALTPTFKWDAPATAPAGGYTYQFRIDGPNGTLWQVPGNNSNVNGLPSAPSVTLLWGVDPTDGSNTPSAPLVGGTTYHVTVTVQDSNGNSAQTQMDYTTP